MLMLAPDPSAVTEPLLPRIAAGDRDAVRACVDRYGGLVWALARRTLGAGPDAEDATQTIFLDLWRSAGRFDPARSDEATFVALIARRRLIDARRKLARRPSEEPLPTDVVAATGPVIFSDEATRATAALTRLDEDQQRAIRLAVYDGLTHEQISERTGMPLGTVKTHIRRGLLKVRELLDAGRVDGGRP